MGGGVVEERERGREREDGGEPLYVGNLDPTWTADDVIDMLRPAGVPIAKIDMKNTGGRGAFAFVFLCVSVRCPR